MTRIRDRFRSAIARARDWLTDTRRQAVHAALGTLATVGVTLGWLTEVQSTAIAGFGGSALALAQGLLGIALLRPSDAARWLGTVGRGAIYTAAASGGAVGIAFGIFGEPELTHALGVVSAGITVLSTLLSVVNVQTVDPAPPRLDPSTMTRSEYQDAIADA